MRVQVILLGCVLCAMTLALAGCASAPPHNAELNQAQDAYNSASSKPQIAQKASDQLQAASANLNKARAALKNDAPVSEVNHYAYLAKRHVAIARQTTRAQRAEADIKQARQRRENILLEARRQSAREAQMKAEAAEARATRIQQQAETARAQNAALQQQLEELKAKQTERGLVLTLGDVLFDLNKADLKSGGTQAVDRLAEFMQDYPDRNVMVEGYTDSTGDADYNQTLSEHRAESVRDALVSNGINPQRVVTKGFGEQYPVADNGSAAGRQRNRRVEIVISNENGTFPKKR